VFSCCESAALAARVTSAAGICAWAPSVLYLETVPAFLEAFYEPLLAGKAFGDALQFGNEAMRAKGAEIDRTRRASAGFFGGTGALVQLSQVGLLLLGGFAAANIPLVSPVRLLLDSSTSTTATKGAPQVSFSGYII
jgi:hypothetical protein